MRKKRCENVLKAGKRTWVSVFQISENDLMFVCFICADESVTIAELVRLSKCPFTDLRCQDNKKCNDLLFAILNGIRN